MTTKNMLGGALINYGETLPTAGTTPDGSLFFKTGGGGEGLYIYRLIPDSNFAAVGNQTTAGWQLFVPLGAGGSGLNADLLDGLDSSAFQPANADLTAFAALAGTGIVVKTGPGGYAARSIAAGSSRLSVANGTGVGGNVTLDVVEASLSLNNIGGTLSVAKGGTNSTVLPAAGSVIFSNGSAYAATAVGTATTGAGISQNWQVLTSTGAGTPAWVNTTSLNVAYATQAASATTATNSAQLGGLVGDTAATPITVAVRDGSADINVRLIRQGFPDQNTISGGMVFRVNNTADNYLRVCNDVAAIRTFLSVPSLTGGGASGTWGINITGNAATATVASNASSISSAVGGSYTWTGVQAFRTVGNTALATPISSLQPTANSASDSASISFHRPGIFGLNMGLDSDNVFRIGGWSAAANRLTLDMNGNLGVAGRMSNVGMTIHDSSPTITFRDTDHRSAFAHVNESIFYILRGGVDATTWDSGPGGVHPMTMSLDTGNTTFAGQINAVGGFTTTAAATFGGTTVNGTLSVNGAVVATGNVTAFSPSDRRLKTDIERLGAAVNTVKKLEGVSYTLKETGRREIGVIAQDVEKVLPEVVRQGSDGVYGVQYGNIVGLLIEAIKEQQAQIDDLQRQVKSLLS